MNDLIDWTEDSDHDGVPDAIENVIENAKLSFARRTFTKRNLYLSIVIGAIIAGYGVFGYMYMSLRDEKIAIQNQYDWFKSEQEIEINKARMEERRKIFIDLKESSVELNDSLDEKREKVDALQNTLINKPYLRSNEDEVNEMDIDGLLNTFDALGFNTIR